jgi:nucleotide-binding universal stress UspA family protein
MTVVVGYIPDQYGEAALTAGIEEAQRRGTGLVVVNATKGDALVDRRYVGDAGLTELESRLAALDVTHEVRQAIGPDVAEEILRVIKDTDAAVVVIGLRHRTPVGKMIMGSVAQRILLDAPCAVLAIKPATASTGA